MHELALMQDLVESITTQLPGRQVRAARLEVGRLSAVSPDALRFCFDVCTRGTLLEGAALVIIDVEGTGWCGGCGALRQVTALDTPCACGSYDVHLQSGLELRLKDVEVG